MRIYLTYYQCEKVEEIQDNAKIAEDARMTVVIVTERESTTVDEMEMMTLEGEIETVVEIIEAVPIIKKTQRITIVDKAKANQGSIAIIDHLKAKVEVAAEAGITRERLGIVTHEGEPQTVQSKQGLIYFK